MFLNMLEGKLFVYDEEFTVSSTEASISRLHEKGQLSLTVNNSDWKTYSFVPQNTKFDIAIASNFIFYKSHLKTINFVCNRPECNGEELKQLFLQMTGLITVKETISRNWGTAEYSTDYKSLYDSIVVHFS